MMVLWVYVCHKTHEVVYIKYMWPLNVNIVHLKVLLKWSKIYKLQEIRHVRERIAFWYISIGHIHSEVETISGCDFDSNYAPFLLFLIGLMKENSIWRMHEFTFSISICLSVYIMQSLSIYSYTYLSLHLSVALVVYFNVIVSE